ncbi:NADH-cytochrome b5 reductase 2 [Haplosporangium sp. Z 11]|nr:NADH-cytochrome b5 reductase 2 [Haplosporangium sp. Z 11]
MAAHPPHQEGNISYYTRIFHFALSDSSIKFGLPTGKHAFLCGKVYVRAYTPISDDNLGGHVEFLIKVYRSSKKFLESGHLSQVLDGLHIGDTVDWHGHNAYLPADRAIVKITLIEPSFTLSDPPKDWCGCTGHIDERMIREYGTFECHETLNHAIDTIAIPCGPSGLIEKVYLPNIIAMKWNGKPGCWQDATEDTEASPRADTLVLRVAVPEQMERALGCIKIVDEGAKTVLDEPFVLKAAENYVMMRGSGFMKSME